MRHIRVFFLAASAAAVLTVVSPDLEGTWAGACLVCVEAAASADQGGNAAGNRVHDGAKGFGDSLLGGIKFVGRTLISPFTGTTGSVGRDADATGQRLHRGAKGFGEGLLDGLRYAGRKIGDFFSGSDGKSGR